MFSSFYYHSTISSEITLNLLFSDLDHIEDCIMVYILHCIKDHIHAFLWMNTIAFWRTIMRTELWIISKFNRLFSSTQLILMCSRYWRTRDHASLVLMNNPMWTRLSISPSRRFPSPIHSDFQVSFDSEPEFVERDDLIQTPSVGYSLTIAARKPHAPIT